MVASIGIRNTYKFSVDRYTGDLYVADVGENSWEEISVERYGMRNKDYGWPKREGNSMYMGTCTAASCLAPVYDYGHTGAEGAPGADNCIVGGYVYRGCAMPDLRGTYFYADFCSAFIRTFTGVSGGSAQNREDRTSDLAPAEGMSIDSISSFGEDARGELYITDLNDGEVYKIVPGS